MTLWLIVLTVFVAEFGDKTQIAKGVVTERCGTHVPSIGRPLSVRSVGNIMRDLSLKMRHVPPVEHVGRTVPAAWPRVAPPLRRWHKFCSFIVRRYAGVACDPTTPPPTRIRLVEGLAMVAWPKLHRWPFRVWAQASPLVSPPPRMSRYVDVKQRELLGLGEEFRLHHGVEVGRGIAFGAQEVVQEHVVCRVAHLR
jgi:hypothetical protein